MVARDWPICEGVALRWHARCVGADSEELAPGLPVLPALQKRNGCAIYLLRSSLRHTSCRWVSAITGGTGPKITGDYEIFLGR